VREAVTFTQAALDGYRETGQMAGDETANALRAIMATALPNEPLVVDAAEILGPAEAYGGQVSFRYTAPLALVLVAIFGTLYWRDRRQGGYRAVRLDRVTESAPAARVVGG
jgi:hypothetical protein